ncbi:MAG: T9SS type A sorting domain-containing protein [Bacteroidetes bacterium]|nr:T9SS type A sorting domain-containing protein [Bacteroidota bacterium]
MNINKHFLVAIFIFSCTAFFGQFTSGNLVVLQAGDGVSTLTNTGNQIILKEYTPVGSPAFSVAISTSVNPLIISGSASSEGGLSLSPNGKYLVFAGYAQSVPNATALAGSASSLISRGVGVVSVPGSYSRVATSSTFYSGNNIRSATSDGNDNYWCAGGNDGTDYLGVVSATTNVQNGNTNTRSVCIFNSNLYFSTGSGTLIGVYQVGTGLPVTSAQTNSNIISTMGTGIGTPSPYSFYFNPAQTVCYIADDRSIANGGGIQKWVYSVNTWTLAYTLGTGATSTVGARGVIADFSTPNVKVYATTSEAVGNRIISIADVGAASPASTLATSDPNTLFRGIAFSPYCTAPQATSILNNAPICANQLLTLDVNPTGTAPFTYSWTGSGSFSSNSVKNPTVTNASTGNYSVTVSNGCGTLTASASLIINPLPTISVNSASTCNGGSATLTASGANTYTWNTSSNSSSIIVTPSVSTNYTISGTSVQGCSNSATTNVNIVSVPNITVNSATICVGNTTTLTASGVSSFTWSTGSNSANITPSPSVTTNYTVSGLAPGCPVIATNTSIVVVNALPSVTLNSISSPVCVNSPTILLSGSPAGGSFSGPGISGNTFNPSTAGAGSFSITYSYTNTNNCSNTDIKTVTVSLCTGLKEQLQDNIVSVFPNPVQNELKININNNSLEYKLDVYSPEGKLVYSEKSSRSALSIDVSAFSAGLYSIRILTNTGGTFIKFLKE